MKGKVTAEMAVRLALNKVEGAYGLVIMCMDEPDKLIAARKVALWLLVLGMMNILSLLMQPPLLNTRKA